MMFRRLNNKKGFIFPFAYFVLAAMTIYVAAFANSSLNNHNITKRNLLALQIKSQVDRGTEYLIYELMANGSSWHTHTTQQQGSQYALIPLTEQDQTPEVALSLYCKIDEQGCYAAKDGGFQGKVYKSPVSGQTIVLCKGFNSVGDSRLYAVKIHYDSLYDYFMFSPAELNLSHITLDALQGRIHSNQDIVLGDAAIIANLSKLSTPKTIRYFAESYIPQGVIPGDAQGRTWEEYYYELRDPWVEPNKDGSYINSDDGHLSGERRGLLMEDPQNPGQYIEYDPKSCATACNPVLYPDDYPEIYQDSTLISYINGVALPNRLNENYVWDRYWRLAEDFADEIIPSDNRYESKTYTNSKLQPKGWSEFLNSYGFEDIIQEANTGGTQIADLHASRSFYMAEAAGSGMSITKLFTGRFRIQVGGNTYQTDASGKIIVDDDLIFEVKSFKNTNSTATNTALVIYVDKMIEKGFSPSNGIIYGDSVNILLDDAETLPDGGLTTVTNGGNIYIKGNYNTESWQPSAVISGGLTYLLSDQFNYPQALPDTFNNIEFPYLENFVEGEQNWYADHYQTMANTVDNDYTYVVSLVGYYGYMPETLENWWYYENPGDLENPPSGIIERKRQVIGSLIKIPQSDINSPPLLDLNQKGSRTRTNPGWTADMGSVVPKDENNYFSYDSHYLPGENYAKPPGDFMSSNIKLIAPLKEQSGAVNYYTNYCPALY